jgi:hypothetical protein
MDNLSKSQLLSFRICQKRFWLEVKQPALSDVAAKETVRFKIWLQLKAKARQLYDPLKQGEVIEAADDGDKGLFRRSKNVLTGSVPIFDAGFASDGVQITADIMTPTINVGNRAWRMIHVRSSTLVRDHHYDDIAIQAFAARRAGVPLVGIALAHIDSNWTYRGSNNYQGLLVESDMTSKAFGRDDEIKGWIWDAQKVLNSKTEPTRAMGRHCNEPHACSFQKHCRSQSQQVEYPVGWIPRSQSRELSEHLDAPGINDMRQIPNSMLNEMQRRVKEHTLSGAVFFDAKNAAADLARHTLPAGFLAFETAQFAIPTWPHTRPFQSIPFQFSIHRLGREGELEHEEYIDLSGNDPSLAFAEALLAACGKSGTIFGYNAGFEVSRIKELADRFPDLRPALLGITERVVDLLKVSEKRYYNPVQEGSWSLKKILPAIAPDMMAERLSGITDGSMAAQAYRKAIEPGTSSEEKGKINDALLSYCKRDTLAMVRLWKFFSGSGN